MSSDPAFSFGIADGAVPSLPDAIGQVFLVRLLPGHPPALEVETGDPRQTREAEAYRAP